jgi:Protein of unknown function (DUF4197)
MKLPLSTCNRRQFSLASVAIGPLTLLGYAQAQALSLSDLTDKDASQGLRAALEKGALVAVGLLGKPDGFLGNEKVRIPLPGFLNDAAGILKTLGQGKRVDELITSMNRAAEAAVPMARDLLLNAVKSMSVTDAKTILSGGENSITQFFAEKTRGPLATKFLPVVTQAIEKVGLATKYNEFAGKAAGFGLVRKEDANIQQYVTDKSLDGLYATIGEEEKKIRQNPVEAGSAILKKVFGAL